MPTSGCTPGASTVAGETSLSTHSLCCVLCMGAWCCWQDGVAERGKKYI